MKDFTAESFRIFDRQWALLTAGSADKYNTMTISWGGLGTLWGKPVVTVYVKPVRYTHSFMDESDIFTVSFYEEKHRKALTLLGTLSGRDTDKVAQAGFTPKALEKGVTFAEATRTLVCRKIYKQDFDLRAIPEEAVQAFYTEEEPHTMYIGEVVDIIE